MTETQMIWLLLVVYQIKHFVADYPLQGSYMLGKFKPFPDCLGPLMAHSAVHGVATFLIATAVSSKYALLLALLDFVVHGCVDYLKANPRLGGRFKALDATSYPGVAMMASSDFKSLGVQLSAEDKIEKKNWAIKRLKSNIYFWWALGIDQMLHHFCHYFIIWCLI